MFYDKSGDGTTLDPNDVILWDARESYVRVERNGQPLRWKRGGSEHLAIRFCGIEDFFAFCDALVSASLYNLRCGERSHTPEGKHCVTLLRSSS